MKFFILGRNQELSKAEIYSYLENREIEFEKIIEDKTILILKLNKDIKMNVQEFGGVLKIGNIEFTGNEDEFEIFLAKNELVPQEKFNYTILGNHGEEIIIDKFKQDRKKALIKRSGKYIKTQKGRTIKIPKADHELFCYKKDKIYYGTVSQVYDYNEVKQRDMKKPVRRESLAISPRLSKILINLSQTKQGELLLDPFCGIGVILQEALVKGINVQGVDKDSRAIENAKRNIKWLEKKYKINATYKLERNDSKQLKNVKFNGIATEPHLGEIIRKKPNKRKSEEIIGKFEKLIIPILKNLKNLQKENAKIAITMPSTKYAKVDMNKICKLTGLKIKKLKEINFPLEESRENQFISRDIVVFE